MSLFDNYIQEFSNVKALVIGDVMLDDYCIGSVNRISPEAPVPVVLVDTQKSMLGGAANVALNIKHLSAQPVICSVIGDDETGREVLKKLEENNLSLEGIFIEKGRISTRKKRVIGNNHQMLRIDKETTEDINKNSEKCIINFLNNLIINNKPNVFVFQDYNKGVLTKSLIKEILKIASNNNIITVVDPKKNNFFEYKQVTLFKPNLKEVSEGLDIEINSKKKESIIYADKCLKKSIGNIISLITLSEDGIFISTDKLNYFCPAHIRKIVDVSGAGDTVLSVLALMLPQTGVCNIEYIAQLANLAGGLACESVGITTITKANLQAHINQIKVC